MIEQLRGICFDEKSVSTHNTIQLAFLIMPLLVGSLQYFEKPLNLLTQDYGRLCLSTGRLCLVMSRLVDFTKR